LDASQHRASRASGFFVPLSLGAPAAIIKEAKVWAALVQRDALKPSVLPSLIGGLRQLRPGTQL